MATINHTHPLNSIKDLTNNKYELQRLANLSDGALLEETFNRDLLDLDACNSLTNEISLRFN